MKYLGFIVLFNTFLFAFSAHAESLKAMLHDVPKPAPEIIFTGKSGTTYTLADFKGKVLLVNFWATWCAPCVRELPALEKLQKSTARNNMEVLTISLDRKPPEAVDAFLKKLNIKELPLLIGNYGDLRRLELQGIPATLIIDRNGKEIGRALGEREWGHPQFIAELKRL